LLDLGDLGLDAADDVERVLAGAHDNDAPDDLATTVELDEATPDVSADGHVGDISDPDRRSARIRRDDSELEILDARHVAAPSQRVLVLRHLDHPPTDLRVRAAHGRRDLTHGDVAGLRALGIDLDLVLLFESADARDFGNAGHALQPIAK
jgi:hypothetical protein